MTAPIGWPACWKPDQEQLIVAGVESQADNILLAVHQEPALRRLRVPLRGQRPPTGSGDRATQHDLLEHFLGPPPAEGTLLVPLIGAPGTGKSHLIRWLKAALPTDGRYEIRHIPREGTSLPDVVERIFVGVDGAEFDELRSHLAEFRRGLDALDAGERLERVATRLMLRMAESLEFGQVPWHRAKDVAEDVRAALCHATVLPALLTDAVVRSKLTREGGAVYRIARDIVQGYVKQEDEDEEDLGFRESDLQMGGLRGASPYAARALVTLRLPGNATAAVQILSDALDQASAEVVPTGSVPLSELLRRFRAQLAREGRELILLFEDIAIARGLQQDLVDALVTTGVREGEEALCVMRVALAVTATYWEEQAPETLSTRAHAWRAQMFDMDVPADEAVDRAPDLVGRYLNAARIGRESLLARKREELADHIENACVDCPFQPRCHPAFGATSEGYGLFPLTAVATRRLAALADRRGRPRLVLSEVVAPALEQHDVMNEHHFPSHRAWRDMIATAVETGELDEIPPSQQGMLERAALDDDARDRARTVLRAWTPGAPDVRMVLEALGIAIEVPEEEAEPSPETREREREPESEPEPTRQRQQPRRDDDARRIEDWGGGAVPLGPQLARRLRSAIWSEVVAGVRWPEFGRNADGILEALGFHGPRQQRQNQGVEIGNTAAGRTIAATDGVEPLVVLEPSVTSAVVLEAFRRLDRGTAGLEELARVRNVVEAAEVLVQERLASLTGRATDLVQLATLAFSPIASAGGASERPTWSTALRSVEEPPSSSARTPAWARLVTLAHGEHERATSRVTALATRSQGGAGAPTALDIAFLDERTLSRDPAGLDRPPRDEQVARRHAELAQSAREALAEETASIRAVLEAIGRHSDDEERLTLRTIDDAVRAAMNVAETAHLLVPHDAVDELRALQLPRSTDAATCFERGWVAVRAAEARFSVDALARIGGVDVDLLGTIRRYLDLASRILERSSAEAAEAIRQRAGVEASGLGEQTRSAAKVLFDRCEVPG